MLQIKPFCTLHANHPPFQDTAIVGSERTQPHPSGDLHFLYAAVIDFFEGKEQVAFDRRVLLLHAAVVQTASPHVKIAVETIEVLCGE